MQGRYRRCYRYQYNRVVGGGHGKSCSKSLKYCSFSGIYSKKCTEKGKNCDEVFGGEFYDDSNRKF